MKILHICPGYFGAKLYENLFSTLQSMEIVNEVFTLPFKNIIQNGNIPYSLKVWEKKFNLLDRLFYFSKQYKIYKKICAEYSLGTFNLIHAHTLFSAGFSAYLIHKKFGLPYIVAVRNTDVNVFLKYMFHLRIIGCTILHNAQNIIFLSPTYRDFVVIKYIKKKERQKILNKSIIIPNGIDEYFFDNKLIVKKRTNNKLMKLIFIGDIDSNKKY